MGMPECLAEQHHTNQLMSEVKEVTETIVLGQFPETLQWASHKIQNRVTGHQTRTKLLSDLEKSGSQPDFPRRLQA